MLARPTVVVLLGALSLGGMMPGVHAAPAEPFLFSRPALATTVSPRAAEFADLDADGRSDLVSAVGSACCPTSIGISVMRARSSGSFDPASVALTTSLPDDLEVLDVNGDGRVDVVAAIRLDNNSPGEYMAEALPGHGDGTFAGPVSLPFDFFAAMAVGRFRENGRISAVAATEDGLERWDHVSGFTFANAGLIIPEAASRLLAVDLQRDGRDELLVYANDTLAIYEGFSPGATRQIPDLAGLRAADVSGDDAPELLATQVDGTVTVLDATLSPVKAFTVPLPARQSNAGDLDGDGLADLVRANESPSVTVFSSKGGPPQTLPLARPATDVFIRDATGDGLADILALEPASSVIEVLEGNGLGGFPGQRPVRPTMSGHGLLERGDFNGDGKPDLVTSPWDAWIGGIGAGHKARVLLGDGDGGLAAKSTLDIEGAVSGLGVADVNGDGKQDVISSEYYAGTSFFLGNGDGTFSPRIPFATCYFNDGLVTGDFNRDGYGDAAFICNSAFYRTTLTVALGSPGGLVRAPEMPLAVNANQTWVLRTGDVNGDGNQDIALAGFDYFASDPNCLPDVSCFLGRSDGPVTFFLGLGNGVFEPASRGAPVGGFIYDLALGDIDGDGRDDLLTAMTYEDRVVIQPGKSDGTVGPPVSIPTYDYPTALRVSDLTGDGKKDLVMTHGPAILSVHPSTGGFTFGTPTSYATRVASGELVTGNYGGDARVDVLAGTGGGVEVFTNGA